WLSPPQKPPPRSRWPFLPRIDAAKADLPCEFPPAADCTMGSRPMASPFRIGLTPDFATQAHGLIEPALAEVLPRVERELMPDTGAAARADVLDGYDAVIALAGVPFSQESLAGLKRLAVIARWGVGYDRIDVAACTANDVILAITPDAVRRPVAEGIFALLF